MGLLETFEFVKGYATGTGSHADFWKIKHKNSKRYYMAKIFLDDVYLSNGKKIKTKYYETLKHEIRTYQSMKSYLISDENVRNLLMIYTSHTVTFQELFNFVYEHTNLNKDVLRHNFIQNIKRMLGFTREHVKIHENTKPYFAEKNIQDYDIEKCTFIFSITKYVESMDFSDFVSKKETNWTISSLCNYFSIILVTIYQMASIGFNHNDLHWSNIFITDKYYGPSQWHLPIYLLVFNNKTFIINNKYTPIIYDFDRTSVYNIYLQRLENLKFGGNCPKYHFNRDFVRTLCNIFQHLKYYIRSKDNLKNFNKLIIDNLIYDKELIEMLNTTEDPSCHMKTKDKENSYQCLMRVLDKGIAEPEKIMSFFFGFSSFENVPTKNILKGDYKTLNFIKTKMDITNLTEEPDFKKYVQANIQFVGKFSETEKYNIMENIRNIYYQ